MKTRISQYQTTLFLIIAVLSTSIEYYPRFLIKTARQDSWIAVLGLVFFMYIFSPVYYRLINRMGNKDLVKFNKLVFSRYLAFPISLVIVFYLILSSGIIVREVSEALITSYMPETPLWFFNITIIVVALSFVYYGLEVIVRSVEISFYLFLISVVIVLLLVAKDVSLELLNPVAYEPFSIIKGAYTGLLFLGEIFLVLIIAPNISHRKKTYRSLIASITITGLILLTVVITIITLFGADLADNMDFPLLDLTRYAEAKLFIQRLDPFFMFHWVGGGVLKTAIFMYCSVYMIGNLFNISYYNGIPFVFVFVFYFSFYFFRNALQLADFLKNIVPFYVLVQIIYPIILIVISIIRGVKIAENQ